MNKKMYLVINHWSNESSCQNDIEAIKLFKNYDKAREYFEIVKNNIKSYDYGYSEIEEDIDYYCEYENGEYLYNHDLVKIQKIEVEDYE